MMLRPLRDTDEDAEVARAVAAAALGAPDALTGGGAPPARAADQGWLARHARHLARTDPGGCWVAETGPRGPVGVVLSARREFLWCLSLLAVVPPARNKGLGTALLARALGHGRGCLRGIGGVWRTSRTPGFAARAYRRAGFTLHPAMRLSGPVDASRLPSPDGPVHEGTPRHRDLLDSVDRWTRGAAHGPDHDALLRGHRLLVVDELSGSGYCYLGGGRVELLAATSRRLATRLLTAALLSVPPGERASVGRLTAEQEWAVDVGLAAGLELGGDGYLCLRGGMRPPRPYVPSRRYL